MYNRSFSREFGCKFVLRSFLFSSSCQIATFCNIKHLFVFREFTKHITSLVFAWIRVRLSTKNSFSGASGQTTCFYVTLKRNMDLNNLIHTHIIAQFRAMLGSNLYFRHFWEASLFLKMFLGFLKEHAMANVYSHFLGCFAECIFFLVCANFLCLVCCT